MITFPKKTKELKCKHCNATVDRSDFNCKTCNRPLIDMSLQENLNKDKYLLTAVLQNQNDFIKIKNKIISQFKQLGYNKEVINKDDTLMLNSDTIEKSYILVKLQGHSLSIEAFRAEKPNIKIDDKGNFVE